MADEQKVDTAALQVEIHALAKEPSRTPFELANKLALLKRHWRKGFNEVLQANKTFKLPLSPRRIHYLVSVAETLPAPEDYPGLETIGWTKLALIAEHLKAKGIMRPKTAAYTKQLLNMGGSRSVRQLKAELANEPNAGKERCVILYFSSDEYEKLEHVLKTHGATRAGKYGLKNKEKALLLALFHSEVIPPSKKLDTFS